VRSISRDTGNSGCYNSQRDNHKRKHRTQIQAPCLAAVCRTVYGSRLAPNNISHAYSGPGLLLAFLLTTVNQSMGQVKSKSSSRAIDAQQILPDVPDYVSFRVLIIGRANAGKTSILQRVCDTTDSPEIYRIGPQGERERVRSYSYFS
jgi:hypothetical protein